MRQIEDNFAAKAHRPRLQRVVGKPARHWSKEVLWKVWCWAVKPTLVLVLIWCAGMYWGLAQNIWHSGERWGSMLLR